MITENRKPIWVTFDKALRQVCTQQGREVKVYQSCTVSGLPISAKYHEEKRDDFTSRQIILTLESAELIKIPLTINAVKPLHDKEEDSTFSFFSNVANILLAAVECKKRGEFLGIVPFFGKEYARLRNTAYHELSFNLKGATPLPQFWDKEASIYTSLAEFLGGELPAQEGKRYAKTPKKKGGYEIPETLQDRVWEWYEGLINQLNATTPPEPTPPLLTSNPDDLPF